MKSGDALAKTPGREGFVSRNRGPRTRRRPRFAGRSAVAVLLLSVACGTQRAEHEARTAPRATYSPSPAATQQRFEETEQLEALESASGAPAEGTNDDLDEGMDMSAAAAAPAPAATAAAPPKSVSKLKKEAAKPDALYSRGDSGSGPGRLGGSHATRSAPQPASPRKMAQAQARVPAASRPVAAIAVAPSSPPAPEFNTEAYKHIDDNPFRLVTEAPLSTFSVDVDTASYSNMRRFIEEGQLPPRDSIRVEEWVNYFTYDDAPPTGGEPVAIASEVTECPWDASHKLLRVALTTQPIAQAAVPPRNLVFLVDVSGSMQPANKLPLLKRGLELLARQLRPEDTLSIVVYAGASGLALPPTSGANQSKILEALQSLESGGSTNGAEGIELAYRVAERQMKPGGINRVVLATDGDFNVGVTSEGDLQRLIEQKRKTGVFLTVLGFGEGNVKDSTMELLADKGNGNYAYVDSLSEARKVLVREAGATLVTVAQDVKLQLEFNPTHVKGYRLVGYENRVLADQDFNDDTKDAGEMGAGHHVTAFYEIVPAGAASPGATPPVDPLKYQTERAPGAAASSDDLVTVKIRYKPPGGSKSLLLSRVVKDRVVPLGSASENLRFGIAVAEYALTLRSASGTSAAALSGARTLAATALGRDAGGERKEFLALMDRAAKLR